MFREEGTGVPPQPLGAPVPLTHHRLLLWSFPTSCCPSVCSEDCVSHRDGGADTNKHLGDGFLGLGGCPGPAPALAWAGEFRMSQSQCPGHSRGFGGAPAAPCEFLVFSSFPFWEDLWWVWLQGWRCHRASPPFRQCCQQDIPRASPTAESSFPMEFCAPGGSGAFRTPRNLSLAAHLPLPMAPLSATSLHPGGISSVRNLFRCFGGCFFFKGFLSSEVLKHPSCEILIILTQSLSFK